MFGPFDGRRRKVIMYSTGVAVFVLLTLLLYRFYGNEQEAESSILQEEALVRTDSSLTQQSVNAAVTEPIEIVVDVKGQVMSPGVYSLKEGSRVDDAIKAAGGFTSEADRDRINLAMKLSDGQAVFIPKIGEEAPQQWNQTSGNGAVSSTSSQGKVNINTADTSELDTLPGIGPSKAEAIIQFRTDNGAFKSIEDLKNVGGIGDKTFEQLAPFITVK